MLLFAGDVIHAGDCYETIHHRIHFYIDATEFADLKRKNEYFSTIQLQPIMVELAANIKWTQQSFIKAVSKVGWERNLRYHRVDVISDLLAQRDCLLANANSIDKKQLDAQLAVISAKLICGGEVFEKEAADLADAMVSKSRALVDPTQTAAGERAARLRRREN
jgi:hypothetical protein